MSLKTVQEVKDSVSAILSGINIENVHDPDNSLERSARMLLEEISIPETTKRQSMTLYGGVYDYSPDESIFGTAFVDLRPQGLSRNSYNTPFARPMVEFDRKKKFYSNGYNIAFEYDNGTPILRVVPVGRNLPHVNLDSMNDTTGWTLAGSGSGLVEDTVDFYQTPASLRFTLTGSSTGTLTKSIDSADLTQYEDVGVVFLAIETPSVTNLTSITLRLGSSASAYDSVTATTGFLGAFQVDKWLLVPFDFSTSSSTGTPDWSAIDYAQLRIAHTGTITNFRVGGMFISMPSKHEFIFETAAIFKATSQNPSQRISTDSDQVILSDSALVIYEYLCAHTIASDEAGGVSSNLVDRLEGILWGNPRKKGLIAKFKGKNPSQRIKEKGSYGSNKRFLR